jgi:hypothetical protein
MSGMGLQERKRVGVANGIAKGHVTKRQERYAKKWKGKRAILILFNQSPKFPPLPNWNREKTLTM